MLGSNHFDVRHCHRSQHLIDLDGVVKHYLFFTLDSSFPSSRESRLLRWSPSSATRSRSRSDDSASLLAMFKCFVFVKHSCNSIDFYYLWFPTPHLGYSSYVPTPILTNHQLTLNSIASNCVSSMIAITPQLFKYFITGRYEYIGTPLTTFKQKHLHLFYLG